MTILQIFLAYWTVDLMSGLYHIMTDYGFNIKSQIKQFREHHETNKMDGFDPQPVLFALPLFLVGLYFMNTFVISLGIFGIFAQLPHYWAHHPNKYIRPLQRIGLIISPEHHAKHHDGKFDQNFCIFTGWNDVILNPVLRGINKWKK